VALAGIAGSAQMALRPIPLLPPVTMATSFFRDMTNLSYYVEPLSQAQDGAGAAQFAHQRFPAKTERF
jgi:hypothetical protein